MALNDCNRHAKTEVHVTFLSKNISILSIFKTLLFKNFLSSAKPRPKFPKKCIALGAFLCSLQLLTI